MAGYDPLDADSDPFRPPDIPTLVGCLHCGQEYDSYRIEWRIEQDADGRPHGFWCCPISGCDGRGFGFDILPIDPNYQDERGGWITDAGEEEDEESLDGDEPRTDEAPPDPDDPISW
jgi:hypothetical protein